MFLASTLQNVIGDWRNSIFRRIWGGSNLRTGFHISVFTFHYHTMRLVWLIWDESNLWTGFVSPVFTFLMLQLCGCGLGISNVKMKLEARWNFQLLIDEKSGIKFARPNLTILNSASINRVSIPIYGHGHVNVGVQYIIYQSVQLLNCLNGIFSR